MSNLHVLLSDEIGEEAVDVAVGDLLVPALQLGLDFGDGPPAVAQLHDRGAGVVDDPDRLRRQQRVLPARGVEPHPYMRRQAWPHGVIDACHMPGRWHRACSTARRT